jgi:hypothetical protein
MNIQGDGQIKTLKTIAGIVLGIVMGALLSSAIRVFSDFKNIKTILQFKNDLKTVYYSSNNMENMFKSYDVYTGNFDIDFSNYIIKTVIDGINAQENGLMKEYNIFLGKSNHNALESLSNKNFVNEYAENIIYISLKNFSDENLSVLIKELKERGTENKIIILDLRDNLGGNVEITSNYADIFLEKGMIIASCKSRTDTVIFRSKNDRKIVAKRLFLIVNEETMSSAEMFSLALRENLSNTLIVGEKTAGKGFGMVERHLSDGHGYYLINMEWYSPLNNNITDLGIQPDVEIDASKEAHDILSLILGLVDP